MHRTPLLRVAALLSVLLLPLSAQAHRQSDPPHQTLPLGKFTLESGQAIEDFSLSYVTHGTLNADKSNAILMVTAIGGNHHRLDFLIGPGKALDTDKYFVICTDAIGNGLTTSPSNSTLQHGPKFPEYNIRDMVNSQYPLVTRHFGIRKLVAVVGASMGGMQALQWAVSYPDMMQAIVPIVPLVNTPGWTVSVLEMLRRSIMSDPVYNGGSYEKPPEAGMRLWASWFSGVILRTPQYQDKLLATPANSLEFISKAADNNWKNVDANNWISQSRAYERHDLGTTKGFGGDTVKALKSIKARTLILVGTGDLLNPEENAQIAGREIADARVVNINDRAPMGHFSAAGATADEVEVMNREIRTMLDSLTIKAK